MAEGQHGVKDTGSSLANLARQLQKNLTDLSVQDDRADDPLPLETRLQGAKQLMSKTKFNEAGWLTMNIFTKRDAMYRLMREETSVQGGMDDIVSMLPSAKLNSLFSKRL